MNENKKFDFRTLMQIIKYANEIFEEDKDKNVYDEEIIDLLFVGILKYYSKNRPYLVDLINH